VGFTDLHHHLLWGIDDGARSPDDSLGMARALVSLGFSDVAVSPHARPEFPDAAACEARRAELQAALSAQGVPLTLHLGAENVLDPELVLSDVRRTIAGGPYLLAEAPYLAPLPQLTDIIFRLKLKRITLLVAHPERCREFEKPGRAADAVRAGALLQLDVGALTGRYGRLARRLARAFLADGLYAVAATDLHAPRDAEAWVGDAIAELRALAGEREVERLFAENPGRVLRGEPVPETSLR
jgi:protein-tyrosine phosphatase